MNPKNAWNHYLFGTRTRVIAGLFSVGALATVCFAQLWSEEEILEYSSVALPVWAIGRLADVTNVAAEAIARRAEVKDPQAAEEAYQKGLTAEQKEADEWSRLAITDPVAFRAAQKALGLLSPEAEAAEEEARELAKFAILNPGLVARELDKIKDPEQKRREELARQSFLDPVRFNTVEKLRQSPTLREKEEEAIYSLAQPMAFKQERKRLLETGSAQPPKIHSSDESVVNDEGGNSNIKGGRGE